MSNRNVTRRFYLLLPAALALGISLALLTPPKPAPQAQAPDRAAQELPLQAHATATILPRTARTAKSAQPVVETSEPGPVFVEPEDGRYEARWNTYTATLTAADGLSYAPLKEGSTQTRGEVRVTLQNVSRGTEVVFDRASDPDAADESAVETENGLAFWRTPDFEERYAPRGDGVEQEFVFDQPVEGSGDLVFRCQLQMRDLTLLPQRVDRNGGLMFVDRSGAFAARYGQVVVRDAGRHGIVIEPVAVDGGKAISFAIPGAWLDKAQYPIVVDPLLGGNIQISPDNGIGVAPPLVVAGSNNFLVVWNDYQAGTSRPQLFASIVSLAGVPGNAFPISDATNVPEDFVYQRQQAAFDGTNWIVVWSDNGSVGYGVRGCIVSPNGNVVRSFVIAGTTGKVSEIPLVAFNGSDYVVAWHDLPPGAASGTQIYYAAVTTAGRPTTAAVVPATTTSISQTLLFLCSQKPSGDTLLLYRDNQLATPQTLSVRIVLDGSLRDPGGTSLFLAEQRRNGYGYPIGVTYVNSEWQILSTFDQTVDSSVFLHHFTPAGVITPPSGVFAEMGLGPTGLQEEKFAAAFAGTNEWLFVRNEKVSSTQYHLLGKRVTFTGQDQDPIPFQIDTAAAGILRSAMAAQCGNSFLTVWLDGRRSNSQPADALNIFGQVVDATVAGAGGIPLIATISASPLTGEPPLDVSFDASGSTGSYDTLLWNFGDGTTATTLRATHTYKADGTYYAQLTLRTDSYSVFDTVVVIVGNGGSGAAQIVGIPVVNSPGMVTGLFIRTIGATLDFSKDGQDTLDITGVMDAGQIPDVVAGKAASIAIGGATLSFNLDAKGAATTSAMKFTLNLKNGEFKLSANQQTLRPALFTLGAGNETTQKGGRLIALPITLTLDTFAATSTVQGLYKAKIDSGAVINYAFLKAGAEVSGSFLITKFSAAEKGKNVKVHTFNLKGQCLRPNGATYDRASAGSFTVSIGNFDEPIPVAMFTQKSRLLIFATRKSATGIKKFTLDSKSGRFTLMVDKIPATGAGGTGLPLAKTGLNITDVNLNLSFQCDLKDGRFNAGRYIFIGRKNGATKSWKLR